MTPADLRSWRPARHHAVPGMSGPELRAAIEAFGMTRADFARACGVTWESVNRWCMSADQPRRQPVPGYIETIVYLARAWIGGPEWLRRRAARE